MRPLYTCADQCLAVELPAGRKREKRLKAGLFYIPQIMNPCKCDHLFETEEGYRHIVRTMAVGAA